jgi:uncharacterized Zn-binding protein involved in type VI secretion
MPRVSLDGADMAGGGRLQAARQSFVRCDGRLIIVVGDPVLPHDIHPNAVVAQGSGSTRINGFAIAREGDPASCGHTCTGSASLMIGD